MTVLDIITKEQLSALREAGFVVVHREPTKRMRGSATRDWPENEFATMHFHRMVGTSIQEQNEEIAKQGGE